MLKRCKSLCLKNTRARSLTRTHTCMHTHTHTHNVRKGTHVGANIVHFFFFTSHFLLSSLLSSTYTTQLHTYVMLRTFSTGTLDDTSRP